MEVEGKEYGKFTDIEYHQVRHGDEVRQEAREVERKSSRIIMEFKQPCQQFSGRTLVPGDYSVPFQFNLPQGIPASIFYQNHKHSKKPEARVKYTIKVKLHQ